MKVSCVPVDLFIPVYLRVRVLLFSALLPAGGCVLPVPLAAYPGRSPAGGQRICFHDSNGEHIHQDGLLVLHRYYYAEWKPKPSTVLLEIEDGTVTIPERRYLSSLWLGWFFGVPWYPVIFESPEESIELVPFMAGYTPKNLVFLDWVEHSTATLLRNDENTWSAVCHWDLDWAKYIRTLEQPPPTNPSRDLVLEASEYHRLRWFVEPEFERVRLTTMPAEPGID